MYVTSLSRECVLTVIAQLKQDIDETWERINAAPQYSAERRRLFDKVNHLTRFLDFVREEHDQ